MMREWVDHTLGQRRVRTLFLREDLLVEAAASLVAGLDHDPVGEVYVRLDQHQMWVQVCKLMAEPLGGDLLSVETRVSPSAVHIRFTTSTAAAAPRTVARCC